MVITVDQTVPHSRLRPARIEYCVVIPDPSRSRVLLLPEGDEWTLPRWEERTNDTVTPRSTHWEWHDPSSVDRALRERFNLDVPTLRCLYVSHVRTNPINDQGYSRFVYETEPAPTDWTPPAGAQWFGPDDLSGDSQAPENRGVHGPTSLPPPPPWYMPGWSAQAIEWIDTQCSRLGLTATGSPVKIRSRERSCEIAVPTTTGWVRFKAVPPIHGHEPALTDFLAKTFPGQVPQVLARDDVRRWMLSVESGGAALDELTEVEWFAAALRRYAEMQIACIPRVGELHALGVPSRPVGELPRKLDDLLAALGKDSGTWPERPLTDTFGWPVHPLTETERDQLHALAPSLTACCAELAQSRLIPDTLDHGNLWPEYVTPTRIGLVISDWSDSRIGHPFFSPWPFLLAEYVPFSEDRRRVRDAYLAPWTRFAPKKDLDRLFDLAQRCYPLDYAVRYHHDFLPAMSSPWEKQDILLHALRVLIIQEYEHERTSRWYALFGSSADRWSGAV